MLSLDLLEFGGTDPTYATVPPVGAQENVQSPSPKEIDLFGILI